MPPIFFRIKEVVSDLVMSSAQIYFAFYFFYATSLINIKI